MTIAITILSTAESKGQCDFAKKKEIKLSRKYYYGEATEMTKEDARKEAKSELVSKINSLYIDNKIPNNSFDSLMFIHNVA